MVIHGVNQSIMANSLATAMALLALSFLFFYFMKGSLFNQRRRSSDQLPTVPKVPGLPLLGNLLQLKEKKPYKTFTQWAEIYGPIYSIKLGSSQVIVLSNTHVAKEAMVTRFSSISTRKLPYALKVLTCDKFMVATSDYNEFHKTVKGYILSYLLGPDAQKRRRHHRETMVDNIMDHLDAHVLKSSPIRTVNFREIFEYELFGLSLKQVLGLDVQSVFVEELGTTMSRRDIFLTLVLDIMEGAIEVDWRDFFPYLRWVPNKKLETKIKELHFRREAVMKALIKEHKRQVEAGKETDCYLEALLSEEKTLTDAQLAMLAWEPIIESSDTTLIVTEWAMFEIAKEPKRQDQLHHEIQSVCGSEKLTEEHLPQLPYLGSIFHETLRKHSPAPLVPLKYVHEDTQIGGYHIPAGSEIAVNIYGCNRDRNQWKDPSEWNPERFLGEKYNPQDLFKTMAFGAGRRACAGTLQAMLIMCLTVGRLVQSFQWRLGDGEEEDIDTVGLTTHKLHPLHAIIKPRC
ncbi:hypothetical protein Nepgr_005905 [Nepenthes gracilis]|uniref:Ent-kaurene oxidase n=1 Tax=Nepenthes gracilis TaxID=150966 RepID=A0AAD3XH17_NEPGR|nr:hypothetical protein Nepgr_005905 [Nepenthes gracilis]